ncbi:MAG: transcriptional regulator [Gammaproteobacteria bacterium]|nr:MAG: transcriptional regulator [Gammaproteobacteria bacterium]
MLIRSVQHMDKFDRVLLLHRIFSGRRRGVSLNALAQELECATKTVTRTINLMRDHLNAPIEYINQEHGYRYAHSDPELYDLPGLWLSAAELQSMVLLIGMLENLDASLISRELSAVKNIIGKNLNKRGVKFEDISQRIKVLPLAGVHVNERVFARVGEALITRQRIGIEYTDYQNNQSSRTLSPQTLVYYRDNWYLDAWCHKRKALRVFALARVSRCDIIEQNTLDISRAELESHFANGYGLFAGVSNQQAELKFMPPIALEIARQRWHPLQQGRWDGEDYYLSFPYSDERELLRDIFRQLPHVEVIAPAGLKRAVRNRLEESKQLYM